MIKDILEKFRDISEELDFRFDTDQAESDIKELLLEKIEGKRPKTMCQTHYHSKIIDPMAIQDCHYCANRRGYNHALDEIKQLIKEM